MKIKIKRLNSSAVIPKYSKIGDAGLDLTAVTKTRDEFGNIVYGTGLAFEIPEGYFMMLVPRSSNCKTDLTLTNHCGIVDSGYRGEVFFKYAENFRKFPIQTPNEDYSVGDRIGQAVILPYPQVEFEEVDTLSDSERGTGGYGSTGK